MKRTMIAAIAVVALALIAGAALAQVPEKMNYQVMLTNDSDEPLADRAVELTFRIYNSDVGGSLYWTETHNTMTNSIGVVSVTLGETAPLPHDQFDQALWLDIEVDSEALAPRRELVASSYSLFSKDSERLAGNQASEFVLDSELASGGVINTPSNPVDWTKLKNVPAGFADGTDDAGGAGDGHSLDADDGDPTNAVYVDAAGNVGIGVTAPANRLTVGDAGASLNYAQFVNDNTGFSSADGLEIGINGAGVALINQQEASGLSFLTDGNVRGEFDQDGAFRLGGDETDGRMDLHHHNELDISQFVATAGDHGGKLYLNDETGSTHTRIQCAPDAGGGRLWMGNGAGGGAFEVDGNYDSSGEAVVSITGSGSDTYFNTGQTGDNSIMLPTNSVSSSEILDEPGVVGQAASDFFPLSGSVDALLSATITIPRSGYVLAIATAEAEAGRDSGVAVAEFGISTDYNSFSESHSTVRVGETAGTSGNEAFEGVNVHTVFDVVGTGSYTYYFLAEVSDGTWDVYDRVLTLVYIPTDYGVVARSAAGPSFATGGERSARDALATTASIAAEREASIAANSARIERELADMRARVADLEAKMGNARP